MANEFKAAAERKRKMTETRKAQKIIGQLEELLLEQGGMLSPDDISAAQASVVRLKEVSEGTGMPADVIMAVNEEAQKVFDTVTEKLGEAVPEETVPEEPVTSPEETVEEESPAEEEAQEPEPEQEAPAEEVKPEEPAANEEPSQEKISVILRRLYNAPRYSRVESETRTRFSALIKPSLRKRMEEDRAAGLIKSPNDLINGLLEIYYGDD